MFKRTRAKLRGPLARFCDASLAFALAALAGCACKPAPYPPQSATLPDKFLVVDWQVEERTALEAAAARGVVVVAYDGRRISVLSNCRAPGRYVYTAGAGPNEEYYALKDALQIGARLPLFEGNLGAEYTKDRALQVRTVTVGEWNSSLPVTRFDLSDQCRHATHVVSALSIGAFELESVDSTHANAELGWKGVGASGHSDASRSMLRSGGDHRQCSTRQGDNTPPDKCNHPVRVELAAIGDPTAVPTEEKLVGQWEGPGQTEMGRETLQWTMNLTIQSAPTVGRCADVKYTLKSTGEPCSGHWVCEALDPTQTMLRAKEVLTDPGSWCKTGAEVVMTVRGIGAASVSYRGDFSDWADLQRPPQAGPAPPAPTPPSSADPTDAGAPPPVQPPTH